MDAKHREQRLPEHKGALTTRKRRKLVFRVGH
jgi:hypothetical protein